jgi:hypothetical protein
MLVAQSSATTNTFLIRNSGIRGSADTVSVCCMCVVCVCVYLCFVVFFLF